MYKSSFRNSKKLGDVGEKEVKFYLENISNIKDIVDVSDNKHYQAIDVDILLQIENLPIFKGEIKTDRNDKTGNVFIEIISNIEKNGDKSGWLYYCKADYLFYYFVNTKILYMIRFDTFKEWFLNNSHKFKTVSNKTSVGNSEYTSYGKLVPITELYNNNTVTKLDLRNYNKSDKFDLIFD